MDDFVQNAADYGSEFEYNSETEKRRKRRHDLATPKERREEPRAPKAFMTEEHSRFEGQTRRYHFVCLDAYSRHKQLVNNYMLFYGGRWSDLQRDRLSAPGVRDIDIVRQHHQFLWSEDESEPELWDKRLAKKYYDKLFKEYCLADISKYKENKFAFRWRTEKEVVDGKGQFTCGNKICDERDGLKTWEVNFAYVEQGTKKNALVKLRLCPDCSRKLNYTHRKKEIVRPPNKEHSSVAADEKSYQEGSHRRRDVPQRSREDEIDDIVNDMIL